MIRRTLLVLTYTNHLASQIGGQGHFALTVDSSLLSGILTVLKIEIVGSGMERMLK